MAEQKKKLQEENKDLKIPAPNGQKIVQEKSKLEAASFKGHQEAREGKKNEKRNEQKRPQEQNDTTSSLHKPHIELSPEEILGFKPNESFSKEELKKRYFNKLRENHPDRVASMGEDFKKLADKNTKEINKAYDKLKKRAA